MIVSMVANPVCILRMGLIPTEVQQSLALESAKGYGCYTEMCCVPSLECTGATSRLRGFGFRLWESERASPRRSPVSNLHITSHLRRGRHWIIEVLKPVILYVTCLEDDGHKGHHHGCHSIFVIKCS